MTVRDGEGFRQQQRDCYEADRAEEREHDEDAAPGGHLDQQPTEQRRGDRRDAAHQHEEREDPRRRGALLAVANDRPGDHDGDTTAEPLKEAEHHESGSGRCDAHARLHIA